LFKIEILAVYRNTKNKGSIIYIEPKNFAEDYTGI